MRKIVANEWVSLDGVTQAPGTPEEDPSGGFDHGGWHIPFFDDISSSQLVHSLAAEQLVDAYRMMIDPLVLGGGKGVFASDGVRRDLELTESQVTSTGALLVAYQRRDPRGSDE